MKFSQGNIVILEFPFSGRSASKVRPAIVVSNSKINKKSDVILAAITSRVRNDEFSFAPNNDCLTKSLHRNDCEIRCHNLFTAEKSVIRKKISSLKPGKFSGLFQKIISGIDPE
jgi:mRNA-degrading endonuclease toxin of MazEF toxin-antitoxin module